MIHHLTWVISLEYSNVLNGGHSMNEENEYMRKCIDYMYKHAMFKFYHVIYNVDYVILVCNILKDDVRLCWKNLFGFWSCNRSYIRFDVLFKLCL